MDNSMIQLIVLAGVAVFLIIRLKNVLGTRDGFEKPPVSADDARPARNERREFEVVEGGPDRDIADHVEFDGAAGRALQEMKQVEHDFSVSEFLGGSRSAYEMILMAFEKGDIEPVRGFLAPEVAETFDAVIAQRREQGLSIEADFIGIRELELRDAQFEPETNIAEITVAVTAELTSVVRNDQGEVVEGDPSEIKRQRDVWTYARTMGASDPNWSLVATGE